MSNYNLKPKLPMELATKYEDIKGVPVFVGDLLKVPHFVAANRRRIYMYKKVMMVNARVHAIEVSHLGLRPVQDCHKCLVEDCGKFEVIDGESVRHPFDDTTVRWWERKQLIMES